MFYRHSHPASSSAAPNRARRNRPPSSSPMSQLVENIHEAYVKLTRTIHIALRTQLGDAHRLAERSYEVARFISAVEPHRHLFTADDLATLDASISDMQEALEAAVHQSSDPLRAPLLVVSKKVPNGKGRGRHRIEIDQHFLASTLQLRGPTGIAAALNCHARTVRRRALAAGLAEAGAPVRQQQILADGSAVTVWQSTGPAIAAISDDPVALDHEVREILQLFPLFGREMIAGALRARGFRVPKNRIAASYLRVRGVPPMFGNRTIERRVYSVPGVNSLWHHDGQHGKEVVFCS
ncbi:hypothetical protein C8R47DRAFT_726352 [Mycena vitilis]|nr:hypothetical protein C8R47DRAFT_726352 [Mycena vitilis]